MLLKLLVSQCRVAARQSAAWLLVEAAFDDVAVLVSLLLLLAEVDGPASAFAAVGDLVVALGAGRGDAALAQPGAVRARGVALVRDHPVRSGPWSTCRPGDPDLVESGSEHARVSALTGRQQERQRPSPTVADKMGLGRQTPTGAADRVVDRFRRELRVVRSGPLCGAAAWQRAGAPARSWSR